MINCCWTYEIINSNYCSKSLILITVYAEIFCPGCCDRWDADDFRSSARLLLDTVSLQHHHFNEVSLRHHFVLMRPLSLKMQFTFIMIVWLAWFRAFLGIPAREVHICGDPSVVCVLIFFTQHVLCITISLIANFYCTPCYYCIFWIRLQTNAVRELCDTTGEEVELCFCCPICLNLSGIVSLNH